MNTLKSLGLAAVLSALVSGGVWAQSEANTFVSSPANFQGDAFGATSAPSATGGTSTTYMDVEDAGNGKYATFGVIDFTGNSIYDPDTGLAETLASIDPTITLSLTDASYAQSRPVDLNFYLSESDVPLSSLKYQAADNSATAGVGTQLGSLIYLGSGLDLETGATNVGSLLNYSLTLPAAAQSYILQQLNTNINPPYGDTTTVPNYTNLRFVITAPAPVPGDGAVANGFGAFSGSTGTGGPQLTITTDAANMNPVPEASPTVSFGILLALGLGGLAIVRRRRAA